MRLLPERIPRGHQKGGLAWGVDTPRSIVSGPETSDYQMNMPPSQAACYKPFINLLLDGKLLLTQEYKFSSYFKLGS